MKRCRSVPLALSVRKSDDLFFFLQESQAEGDECSGGRGGAAAETAEDDELDHRGQGNNTSYEQFPFPISLDGTR